MESPSQGQTDQEITAGSSANNLAFDREETSVANATTKQLVDDGIFRLEVMRQNAKMAVERDGRDTGAGREFSLAITALEEAKLRLTRGLAKYNEVFNEVDLELDDGLGRARENFERNVAGNEDDSPQRS